MAFSEQSHVGSTLRELLGTPMPVLRFLELALTITEVLGSLHQQQIQLHTLNPDQIQIHPDETILIAQPMSFDPAYMAPEMTGRTSQPIDHRADLYSLGIIFYEMLTGARPFEAEDLNRWAFHHIASPPPSPLKIRSDLPSTLADMVLKLLKKNPDERYQTATGLIADLSVCKKSWTTHKTINSFTLGKIDVPTTLIISQTLVGRKKETAIMLETFKQLIQNEQSSLIVISGYEGMGKSTLVKNIIESVLDNHSFFLKGKFECLRNDIPYGTLIDAFNSLIQQLLKEQNDHLQALKLQILTALHDNSELITRVLPQLELIIGKPIPAPDLPPQESILRFEQTFWKFISVFAVKGRPLVLFLDDLQWADSASLRFIENLMLSGLRNLLLITAYRDKDMESFYPMLQTLETIQLAHVPVHRIKLPPLTLSHINSMISDTLHAEKNTTQLLSKIIYNKTGGNPFFSIQMLIAIYKEGILKFDPVQNKWTFDAKTLQSKTFSDNVAELLATKLRQLSPLSLTILQAAAAIGTTLNLDLLKYLTELPAESLMQELHAFISEGLLMRLSAGEYKFSHDRIHQTICQSTPNDQLANLHYAAAGWLLNHLNPNEINSNIFHLVNHFDYGLNLAQTTEEKKQIVDLNVMAGDKAMATAAFLQAASYYSKAGQIFGPQLFSLDYQEAFHFTLRLATCNYITGQFEQARTTLNDLLNLAATREDKTMIYSSLATLYSLWGDPGNAIQTMIQCAALFGLAIRMDCDQTDLLPLENEVWQWLRDNGIEKLDQLPRQTDPELNQFMDVIISVLPVSYYVNAKLHRLLVFTLFQLTLRNGILPASTMGLTTFAYEIENDGKYEEAYHIAQIAYRWCKEQRYHAYKPLVLNTLGAYINAWTQPLPSSIYYLDQGIRASIDNFNIQYTCIYNYEKIYCRLMLGHALKDLLLDARYNLDLLRKNHFMLLFDAMRGQERLIANLLGTTSRPDQFDGDNYSDEDLMRSVEQQPLPIVKYSVYFYKLFSACIYNDIKVALTYVNAAESHLRSIQGQPKTTDFYFFKALTLTADYPQASAPVKQEYLRTLDAISSDFSHWEHLCPQNYAAPHALIRAEINRIRGNPELAEADYELAIYLAAANQLKPCEAKAYERAAHFYADQRREVLATIMLREAYRCYDKWGVRGKVQELEKQFPFLDKTLRISTYQPLDMIDTAAIAKATQMISGELNLTALMKNLMQVVIENAGAQKALLILNNHNFVVIAAQAASTNEGLNIDLEPISINQDLAPLKIINFVTQSREKLLLQDASSSPLFEDDPYIAKNLPLSILCIPILRQNLLTGLLYLENNLIKGAFTLSNEAALEILAAQAAISIDNARLYQAENDANETIRTLNNDLEKKVAQRTLQLQHINEELESFSYSISHDLRAPLRVIGGFSQILQDDYGALLDPTGNNYLNRIIQNATHMSDLIDALLAFSKISRSTLNRKRVNLSQLARTTIRSLRTQFPERRVVIDIEPDIEAEGDQNLLSLVLDNLIGNAWKFTSKRDEAHIQFFADKTNTSVIYGVQDNGVGFDAKQEASIYEPFRRLHRQEDFPGTGIGLATVKRIINRHGGQIWAVSTINQGSTFYFSLESPIPESSHPTICGKDSLSGA